MAKLTRKEMKVFGQSAGPTEIAQIGSLAAAAPIYSTDPDVIQALSNYLEGWYGVVIGGNSPAIQDMNALCFLFARQLAYLFQTGIAEWNTTTTYYIGSFASNGGPLIYVSIANDNTGNALTDTTKWRLANSPAPVALNPATQSPRALTVSDSNAIFLVNTANGAQQITLYAAPAGYRFTVKDVAGLANINVITIVRAAAESIENLAASFACEAPYGVWTFVSDGANWWLD